MSLTQGVSWQLLGYAPFATRYHAKMVAASNGVLLLGGGATDALPTNGGASQAPDVNLNDLWASLDGGFTWGQCSAQLFPFSGNASAYPRGTGRQDFLMQLDPATGIVYVGAGQGRDQTGSQVFFNDLYRLPISLYSVNALAAACGGLSVPAAVGLQVLPVLSGTVVTTAAPWAPRAQAGLYVVSASTSDVPTTLTTSASATGSPAVSGSLVVFGGWSSVSGSRVGWNDTWYSSSSGAGWASVSLSSSSAALGSPVQGQATCVDIYAQRLYSVGGGQSDSAGTNTVYSSSDLGQTWALSAGGFDGRFNALCLVDSYSRLYVMAGKLYNVSGVYDPSAPSSDSGDDISDDVWQGVPSGGGQFTWTQQTVVAAWPARDGPAGATVYSALFATDLLYLSSGYLYNSAVAQQGSNDDGIGTNDGQRGVSTALHCLHCS